LPDFASRFKEVFPESDGNPYDFLVPPNTLGGWLRNERLRRGMPQKELARALRGHVFSVIRYEHDRTVPEPDVRLRLRNLFGNAFERFLEGGTIYRRTGGKPMSAADRSYGSRS